MQAMLQRTSNPSKSIRTSVQIWTGTIRRHSSGHCQSMRSECYFWIRRLHEIYSEYSQREHTVCFSARCREMDRRRTEQQNQVEIVQLEEPSPLSQHTTCIIGWQKRHTGMKPLPDWVCTQNESGSMYARTVDESVRRIERAGLHPDIPSVQILRRYNEDWIAGDAGNITDLPARERIYNWILWNNPVGGMIDGFFHVLLLVIGSPMCYNLSTNR